MEYHSELKGILANETTCMYLEDLVVYGMNQSRKCKYCLILHKRGCGVVRSTGMESRVVDSKCCGKEDLGTVV